MKTSHRLLKPEKNGPLKAGISLAAFALAGLALSGASPSPYAGQQTREIKALSSDDVADLLAGRGMGLAKAGELNGYPGPAHVLELADELGLDADQRRAIGEIRARMTAAAKPLGAEILRRERDLDGQFAGGSITEPQLATVTAAIADLEGRLRATHLSAHLATKALLTSAQIARYQQLRGYDATPAPEGHVGRHHHAE
jgi:hypothetical protein